MPLAKAETRQLILDGAKKVVREKGLAGATTREIAREVGCADGTLYVHFADRVELFLALLRQSLPPMTEPLRELEYLAGRGTVRANLETVVGGALAFMREVVPLVASLFAEPELLRAHREELRRRNEGPHLSMAAVEKYIRAEQRLGRIDKRVNPKAVYALLYGACLHRVFISHFLGQPVGPSDEVFIKQTVATMVNGLRPGDDRKDHSGLA
jgi:AcrR family transcriptional regulator